jgi:hypothetical protein
MAETDQQFVHALADWHAKSLAFSRLGYESDM